ncbi:hypothetical protein CEXT_707871, partial [Caerostris extrusa]
MRIWMQNVRRCTYGQYRCRIFYDTLTMIYLQILFDKTLHSLALQSDPTIYEDNFLESFCINGNMRQGQSRKIDVIDTQRLPENVTVSLFYKQPHKMGLKR